MLMETGETIGKALLALDDLYTGQKFVSQTYQLDSEHIKDFGLQFDPQPFHTDEKAAESSFFGGLAASGWHTAAISMRLIVRSVPLAGGIIGAGSEISWPRPTRPGDVLQVESEILDIKPSRSKPDRGIVTVRSITRNQDGHDLQVLTSKLLVMWR
jgi:acyl dehydratase